MIFPRFLPNEPEPAFRFFFGSGRRALAIALLAAAQPALAETVSSAAQRTDISLTIYADQALVSEQRRVEFAAGANQVAFHDVPAELRPETAFLEISGRGVTLSEIDLQANLLTPANLMERQVGKTVTVIRTNPATGAESRETATLLSSAGGVPVLRFADHIEVGAPGRLAFPAEPPPGLRQQPTLVVTFAATSAGARDVRLSYLTEGLSWRADYVADLDASGRASLTGWASLNNRTAQTFAAPTLHLIAGQPNRVGAAVPFAEARMAQAAPAKVREETAFEYRRYTVERPVTLEPRSVKQVALFAAREVPVTYEYLLQGGEYYFRSPVGEIGRRIKPALFVSLQNRAPALGRALPAGIVRFYRDGQFVGEDHLEATASGETVRLRLGETFDVTADKRQTSFRRISDLAAESAYRVELRNAKKEAVTVKVQEPVSGEWRILAESQPHAKESAQIVSWQVKVPAEGRAVLEYTVQVR